jgi:hypothetical protein
MPDELMENPEFEIDYVSQLAQAQKRSELNSLLSGLSLVGQVAGMIPDVLDKVSGDATVDEAWDILGAPVRVLRSDTEVQEIREARAEAMAKQQEMEMVGQASAIGKTMAEGEKALAQSAQTGTAKRRFE